MIEIDDIKRSERRMIKWAIAIIFIGVIGYATFAYVMITRKPIAEHRKVEIDGCLWIESKQDGRFVSLVHHPKCLNHTTKFR